MKVLTFVIPSYNSEAFLDKGLGSMLVPEILDRLEILVVNDGSADGTAALAQKYADQYPNTVRLISQENKGHGGALNTGLAAATGKYVKVIDADDWVVSENLATFLDQLEKTESDVVLTHYHTVDIGTGEVKCWKTYPEAFDKDYDFSQIMASWRSFDRALTFHGITYRTDFYREKGQMLVEHTFYEDHEYATYPCCYAKSIRLLDLYVYEYRIGDVNQSVSMANQLKRLSHTQRVLEKMEKLYAQVPDGAGRQYAAMKIQGLLMSYLCTALLVEPDRVAGRAKAKAAMEDCTARTPEAAALAGKKYRLFLAMNRLGLRKKTWDSVLRSRVYNALRGNHSFADQ